MSTIEKTFASRWKALRVRFGESQEVFAKRFGVSRNYANMIENGREPGPKLAKLFDRIENHPSRLPVRPVGVLDEPSVSYGLFTGPPPPVNVLLPFIIQQCQILLQQGRTLRPAERSVHFGTLVNYVEMAKASAKAGHWDETK